MKMVKRLRYKISMGQFFALDEVVQPHFSVHAVVLAFLQPLYLEWQETLQRRLLCCLFWFCLPSCLTSLHPPLQFCLADLALAAGLKQQIRVVRTITAPMEANRHHWGDCQYLCTFRANRERTMQALHLRQAKVQVPSAALLLHATCLQFSDNFFSPPPSTEVRKIYYPGGCTTIESVMCEEIINDTIMNVFWWVEKSLK